MMQTKQAARVNKEIVAKAKQVLELAQTRARTAADWLELHFALFGAGGLADELFTTETERTAFCQTAEYKRILKLMDSMPRPTSKETRELVSSANGAISVRLPRSVHAALLAEAKEEGVSLNQLCLSKLIAQLKAVV